MERFIKRMALIIYIILAFLPLSRITAADSSLALRMTAYRFPHHGYRSFAAAQDDALPWIPLYRQAREQLKSRLCLSV